VQGRGPDGAGEALPGLVTEALPATLPPSPRQVVGQFPAASLWARGQSHTPHEPGPLAQREAEGD